MTGTPSPLLLRLSSLGGLLVRRERWSLSGRGWLVLLLSSSALFFLAALRVQSFLSVSEPVSADFLVAEGWIPDYALDEVLVEFRRGTYRKLLTCGSITKDGWNDVPRYTSADWAAQRLKRRGLTDELVAIPCRQEGKDRTYHSFLEVHQWFVTNEVPVLAVNVVTLGPHARRSRLLAQKAFGSQVKIGIIAVPSRDYDADHWWRSSDGVRETIGEVISYLYARVLFIAD